MGLRKSHIISLKKICDEVGIGYQRVFNNLKMKEEHRSISDEEKQSIFKRLDEAVLEFKNKF